MAYAVPMWAGAGNVTAGFPPTLYSIATSSSGNYNYAMLQKCFKNLTTEDTNYFPLDGSEFSRTAIDTSAATMIISASGFNTFINNGAGSVIIYDGGYLREAWVSPPTYAWVYQNLSSSLSNSCTFNISALVGYKTVQDCTTIDPSTANRGINNNTEGLVLLFGGGRGTVLTPASGDTMEWEVKGTSDAGTAEDFVCKVSVTFTP